MQTVNADINNSHQASAAKATQDHLWFLESMDRVHRAIQGTQDLNQMMSDVLDVTLLIYDCDRALLAHPCDPDTPTLRIPMRRTRPEYQYALGASTDYPAAPDVIDVLRILR